MPVKVSAYFVRETTLTEHSLHEMIIATTYSKKPKGTCVDGVYLATIDQSGMLAGYKIGYYEFPLEDLAKL